VIVKPKDLIIGEGQRSSSAVEVVFESGAKINLGLVEIPRDGFLLPVHRCRCTEMGMWTALPSSSRHTRGGVHEEQDGKPVSPFACHSPAIHLPLAMSYIALERIFCHPLLCMLLKLRYIMGSNPTLSAMFSIT
jgi:hypothetical protein